jgi:hypothetical protein
LAAGIALSLSLTVFAHFSSNHDEPVYVLQAEMLQQGHLTLPASTIDPFFRPWLFAERDGRLFSVFPPVWPSLLAASETATGTERGILVVDAAAAVVLAYLFTFELLGRRTPAIATAALLAVSPFFIVLAGTRLSYPMALVLELAFGWTLLRARRTGRGGWYLAAGTVWGTLAFARPLDGLMFGFLAGCALVVVTLRRPTASLPAATLPTTAIRRRLVDLARQLGLIGLGASLPLAVGAVYNTVLTGSPLRFPLAAAGGSNGYGFGLRQLAPDSPVVDFQPHDAWRALTHNLFFLPRWSPGSFLIVGLAAAGLVLLIRQGRRGTALLLFSMAAIVPIGNFPYWGNVFIVRGKRILGPHYYLAILVPVLVFSAVALVALAKRWPRVFGFVMLAMVVATGLEVRPKLEINSGIACTNRQPRSEIERALASDASRGEAVAAGAIVFVPASPDGAVLLHPFPELSNPPDLRAPVLYAATLGPRSFEVAARYPERGLYRLGFRVPPDGNLTRRVPVVDRIRPTNGSTVRIPFEIVNPGAAQRVSVFANDGSSETEVVLDTGSVPGRSYQGAWILGPEGLTADLPGMSTGVPTRWGGAFPLTLTLGVALGPAGVGSERFETHFWMDGAADRVSVLAPGEGFHRNASTGVTGSPAVGLPVAEDIWPIWRVTGDLGGDRRFPYSDPCSS